MMFIPIRKIYAHELEGEFFWIVDKIAHVLFSEMYNSYAVGVARNTLCFLESTNFITYKQAKLIKDLKPSK